MKNAAYCFQICSCLITLHHSMPAFLPTGIEDIQYLLPCVVRFSRYQRTHPIFVFFDSGFVGIPTPQVNFIDRLRTAVTKFAHILRGEVPYVFVKFACTILRL